MLSRSCSHRRAFSLLELSIVLAVISLLLGGVLNVAAQMATEKKQAEYQVRIEAIERALVAYSKANRRLPCPGDGTFPLSSLNYGTEAGTPGACADVNFLDGNTAGGMLPTRVLNLPDEYGFDPWGGRFTYVLDTRATESSAFAAYNPQYSTINSLLIKDAASANTIMNAMVLVLSHGPNGHGAFQLSGSRKIMGSNSADEWQNCACNATAATTFDNVFVQKTANIPLDPTQRFDDLVRIFRRGNFLSAAEQVVEK